MIRTTICLPRETYSKLLAVRFAFFEVRHLAVYCLMKYIRQTPLEKFSTRPTIKYNPDPSDVTIEIKIEAEEHHQLRMYRAMASISISYLTHLAVLHCLDGLI